MSNTNGDASRSMSWMRAAIWSVLILIVGFGVLVIGTNKALTELTGINRHGRVAVATSIFVVAFVALAWTLRRLQRRNLI